MGDPEITPIGHPWLREMLRRAWESSNNQREREWLCFRMRDTYAVMVRTQGYERRGTATRRNCGPRVFWATLPGASGVSIRGGTLLFSASSQSDTSLRECRMRDALFFRHQEGAEILFSAVLQYQRKGRSKATLVGVKPRYAEREVKKVMAVYRRGKTWWQLYL